MIGNVYVRAGTANDQDTILEIARSLPEWFTEKGLEEISSSLFSQKILIAYANHNPIGFAIYKINNNTIWLEWLAVCRKFQNKGVGTFILYSLEDIGKKQDASTITLRTLGGDDYQPYVTTNKFYKHYGFIEMSRTENVSPEWPIEVVLEKSILT